MAQGGEGLMPAKSKAQQKAFGLARSVQKGERPPSTVGKMIQHMAKLPTNTVKEFAETPGEGLPSRVAPRKGKAAFKARFKGK